MINKNTCKHRKIRASHNTCLGCQMVFLSTKDQHVNFFPCFSPSLLPAAPRDHPVCLGTRLLHWVWVETTHEDDKREEKELQATDELKEGGGRTALERWRHQTKTANQRSLHTAYLV